MSVESAAVPWVRRVDVSRLEAVKWLAFAAMLADHFDLVFFGRSLGLSAVGAFAFPVFCLLFGMGVSRSRAPGLVAARLLAPGFVAGVCWWWLVPAHPINVLLVFAILAGVAALEREAPVSAVVAFFAVAVAFLAVFGEGGIAAPVLVFAGWLAVRLRSLLPVLFFGSLWFALAPSPAAFLAVLAVCCWPTPAAPLRRVPGLFAWAYAAHLAVFLAVVSSLPL